MSLLKIVTVETFEDTFAVGLNGVVKIERRDGENFDRETEFVVYYRSGLVRKINVVIAVESTTYTAG